MACRKPSAYPGSLRLWRLYPVMLIDLLVPLTFWLPSHTMSTVSLLLLLSRRRTWEPHRLLWPASAHSVHPAVRVSACIYLCVRGIGWVRVRVCARAQVRYSDEHPLLLYRPLHLRGAWETKAPLAVCQSRRFSIFSISLPPSLHHPLFSRSTHCCLRRTRAAGRADSARARRGRGGEQCLRYREREPTHWRASILSCECVSSYVTLTVP